MIDWIASKLFKLGLGNRKLGERLELAYWKRAPIPEWKLDPEFPLQPRIEELLSKLPERRFQILDVGAGMLTTVGKKSKFDIDIDAIDPLADLYWTVLEKRGVNPIVKTQNIPLSAFHDNSFDIVFARNSIDHAENPRYEIFEMERVCRGYVLMEHFINTGQTENYRGLHQWNFDTYDGNDFVIWNKNKTISVSNASCNIIHENGYEWLITVIDCTHKTRPAAK